MIIEPTSMADAIPILKLQKLCYTSEAQIYNDYSIPPMVQTLEEMKSDLRKYFFSESNQK
jgi:hypothetical protein